MTARAAIMARRLSEELADDADFETVQAFVIANFSDDLITDLDAALEIMDEIEKLDDIDKFVRAHA